MKQKTAGSKIYAICIALALLVLLAVNVTYAYFSANKMIQSDGAKMGSTTIRWAQGSWNSGVSSEINVTAINLDGTSITSLSRGGTFYIKESNTTLSSLGLFSPPTNPDIYARFWVDAYITGNSLNYGQYFEFAINTSMVTMDSRSGTENGVEQTNNIYFVTNQFSGNTGSLVSSMKLSEDAPMELLNNSISLSIHVEAVQANKDAVQALWGDSGDWRGYLTSWII